MNDDTKFRVCSALIPRDSIRASTLGHNLSHFLIMRSQSSVSVLRTGSVSYGLFS